MSLRRSTRLRTIKEEPQLQTESESETTPSSSPKPKSKTIKRSSRSSHSTSAQKTPKSRASKLVKSTKRETKAVSKRHSSSSEKVLTPPTPEITVAMLTKKPWLSQEFLFSVMEQLKSSSTESKENPKMLSLVGPMAAGKSTVKRQLDFNDAVNLDVDEVKIIAVREFGQKAKGIFTDFGKIIQLLGVIIINNKYDFILDTTGKMKEPIKYVMKQAKEAGYTIDIAIVYSTRDLCKTRAEHRNITYTARDPVPSIVVGKVYDEFKDSKRAKSYIMGIKDIVDMTDNLYLFDNSRCTPEAALIMEKHGSDMTVHEDFPDFYGVSVSQLSPKLVAHGIKKTRKHRKKHDSNRKSRRH
jgi:predicted ABC-type ATPase